MNFQRFSSICSLFFFLASHVHADGIIKGKVFDKATGEPLIGATVILEGTSLATATDTEGYYAFIKIQPGIYDVRVSYIGYQTMIVSESRVHDGLSTETDFPLEETSLELPVLTIIAERPLVNKSSTNAVRITTNEEIAALPTRNVQEILALQPGVSLQNGNVHIRGGRSDETGFYLEGVSIADPQYGGIGLTIVPEAIEEIIVQSAGYSAEYGRANAGIAQHQLRSGGRDLSVSLDYSSDNMTFAPRRKIHDGERRFGQYWRGYNELTGTIDGPLLDNRIRFFTMGNYLFREHSNPQTFEGISIGPVIDPFSGDSVDLTYPAGGYLGNQSERYTFTGTLGFDFYPLKVRLSGSHASTRRQMGAEPQDAMNLARIPLTMTTDGFISGKATYFFTPETYLELSGGYFRYYIKQYDPHLKDNFVAYGDSAVNANLGFVWERTPGARTGAFQTPQLLTLYGYNFVPYGYPFGRYQKFQRDNYSFTASFATNVSGHRLKVGGDYQLFTIRTFEINPSTLAREIDEYKKDTNPSKGTLEDVYIAHGVNNYGYDVFGDMYDGDDFMGPRHPVFASAYVQDRFEIGDLTLNAGFRYDYINTHSFPFKDPANPDLSGDPATREIFPDGLAESTPYHGVSPRFGAAFAVTDRTVFHVQYAKLVQQSRLRDVNLGLYSWIIAVREGVTANPLGYDLRPTQTTQYEIGFTQQLGEVASLDITAFYKDVKDQITMQIQEVEPGSGFVDYPIYANGDYATTKGLEFFFRMKRVHRLRVQASISLQDAQGSGSFPNSNYGIVLSNDDKTFVPQYVSPLSYDQTVRANVNLDYRFGPDEGGIFFAQTGINLIGKVASGHPYTQILPETSEYNGLFRSPSEALNTSRTPWTYTFDLRLDRTIALWDVASINVYVAVTNLFDTKNVLNVFMKTGSPDDDGFLSDPERGGKYLDTYGEEFAQIYRSLNIIYQQPVGYFNEPYFYSPSREIRFGIRVEM